MGRLASLLWILTACSDRAEAPQPSPPPASAPGVAAPDAAVAAAAAPPDVAIDAAPWPLGERPLPRSAATDNPVMCKRASACTEACDAGDGAGCYWLGIMYVTKSDVPSDVPHDPQRGLELLLRACDHGITLGCNGAAQIFRLGSLETPVDLPRAKRLFDKACGLGMEAACMNAKSMRRR